MSETLAILCGGRSRRLGEDKGLFAPLGDESLMQRAVRLWSAGFDETLVVVRDESQAERYRNILGDSRARVVIDAADQESCALTGVVTALAGMQGESVTVACVDQVTLRSHHLHALGASDGKLAAAFVIDDEGVMPFPSVWKRETLPALRERLAAGECSVRAALRALPSAWISGTGMEEVLTFNGNTHESLRAYFGEPLHDAFGRRLHYLRLSLTEACNMACTYCLPDGFPEWYRHKAKLDLNQLGILLAGFRRLGFRKVRLTGGEPTLHPDCLAAVARARALGFERICLSTNGLLIRDLRRWRDEGLDQINVSLDSLDRERFRRITKSARLETVLSLIDEAITLGMKVKVNTVLLRSINGDEVERLIEYALARPLTLRFIELMPTHLNRDFHHCERVPGTEIVARLRELGLTPQPPQGMEGRMAGPAVDYAVPGSPGRIGLINPLSCNFCEGCNRLRVTARGALRLCLFGESETLLDLSSPGAVADQVRGLIGTKPERHHLEREQLGDVSTFRVIGG